MPFPDPSYQPYHIAVDKDHNVWANMWTTDRIARYNPNQGMDVLRYAGSRDRNPPRLAARVGVTKVTVPLYRNSKMGAMTLRTEAEIAALKAQVSH